MYPEANPSDTEQPTTHYPFPGLEKVVESGGVQWRGLYFASWGSLYGVVDNTVYQVTSAGTLVIKGSLLTTSGPVSMIDNNDNMMIGDGTQLYSLGNGEEDKVIQQPGVAGSLGYLDGFIIGSIPNTQQWFSTLNNTITQDPLYIASKSAAPDILMGLTTMHREIYLIGEFTSEVWYNTGGPLFPFSIFPGVFLQVGTPAAASIALAPKELKVFFLAQTKAGKVTVEQIFAYQNKTISTDALEVEIQGYPKVSDALGFTFQTEGHLFYCLVFPSANKTWLFDDTTQAWIEWVWTDDNGDENRSRANCAVYAYGKVYVGDWQNGKLYLLNPNATTDDGKPIVRRRSFMHLVEDGKRISFPKVSADIQTGTTPDTSAWKNPFVPLVFPTKVYVYPVPTTSGLVGTNGVPVISGPSGALISNTGPDPSLKLGWGTTELFSSIPVVDQFGQFVLDSNGSIVMVPDDGTQNLPIKNVYLTDPQKNLPMGIGDWVTGPAPEEPLIFMRYSKDRGTSFSNPIAQTLGAEGNRLVFPSWGPLGQARDLVIEFFWSCPTVLGLNGAYLYSPKAASS